MPNPEFLTTIQAAARLCVKPQTLRASLARDGAYFGVRPRKHANGRLLWPAAEVERLLRGEVEHASR